jgi:hypothetical protein
VEFTAESARKEKILDQIDIVDRQLKKQMQHFAR